MNERMECLAPWALRACGVDWNGGAPIVVEARMRGGRLILRPLPPESLPVALSGEKTAVAAALPPGRAMAVWLQTPLTARAKARRVLPTLLDMAMPFALEDCVYAFSAMEPLPTLAGKTALPGEHRERGKLAALAVAARRDDVAAQLAVYAGKGFDPHVLDHEGLALWTEAQRMLPAPDADGVRAVVWVREGEALLALGAGQRFWSAHRIADIAGGTLVRTVRVQLDAVAGGGHAKAPLTWLWGGASASACAALRSRVEADLPAVASVNLPNGEAFLAGALAVRALMDGPLQFNMRRESLAHPLAKRQTDAQQRRLAARLLAAALVLLVANGVCAHVRVRRLQALQAQFKATIDRVTGWPVAAAGENALLIAQRELAARQEAYRPVVRVFGPSLLETLDRVLSAAASSGVSLRSVLLHVEKVSIQGEAAAAADAQVFLKHFQQDGYDAELNAMPVSGDQPIRFEIAASTRGQP
jgi:hypothetical protein